MIETQPCKKSEYKDDRHVWERISKGEYYWAVKCFSCGALQLKKWNGGTHEYDVIMEREME